MINDAGEPGNESTNTNNTEPAPGFRLGPEGKNNKHIKNTENINLFSPFRPSCFAPLMYTPVNVTLYKKMSYSGHFCI